MIFEIQVFLSFANFYKWFTKSFSKFFALFILILKIIGAIALIKLGYTNANNNKYNTNSNNYINVGKIDNKITNLSNKTKVKKSSNKDFFISKASLTFT